ncbi:MAG TPA: hypothetical protein ENN22_16465 [bacterium]|nr:hypothetical protein [bacterium]
MKCDQVHPLLIDFLYDEISEADNQTLQSHLNQCEKCRNELASLRKTSRFLQKWEDEAPDFKLTMVTEKISWSQNMKQRWQSWRQTSKKFGLGLAYAVAVIFLLLAIGNTEVSYQQGSFRMRIALFPKSTEQQTTELADAQTRQLIEKLQQENYYLTKTLIEQSEARQRQEWAMTLAQFNKELEQQRMQDWELIGAGLIGIERTTSKQLQRTDNSLNELMRYISSQK